MVVRFWNSLAVSAVLLTGRHRTLCAERCRPMGFHPGGQRACKLRIQLLSSTAVEGEFGMAQVACRSSCAQLGAQHLCEVKWCDGWSCSCWGSFSNWCNWCQHVTVVQDSTCCHCLAQWSRQFLRRWWRLCRWSQRIESGTSQGHFEIQRTAGTWLAFWPTKSLHSGDYASWLLECMLPEFARIVVRNLDERSRGDIFGSFVQAGALQGLCRRAWQISCHWLAGTPAQQHEQLRHRCQWNWHGVSLGPALPQVVAAIGAVSLSRCWISLW